MTDLCVWCGWPAVGQAEINGEPYCHGDKYPSCFELATWASEHRVSKYLRAAGSILDLWPARRYPDRRR